MENAAEALKLGAWVLIFVAALTITINAFSLAKQSIDGTVQNIDREYVTTYVDKSDTTQRSVGIESIVPSIYRAFNDNYKIIFQNYKLYGKIDSSNNTTDINYIDLEKESLSDSVKEMFIKIILMGTDEEKSGYTEQEIKNTFPNIIFEETGLLEKIKGQTFIENLGVYYQEETKGGLDTPNANKTEKRVITYIQNK
ncbi:MAG: hypothetical protein IKF97_00985 [Clostridia bacterium]|nr:hypothetical protein [Clostridia bacterium]